MWICWIWCIWDFLFILYQDIDVILFIHFGRYIIDINKHRMFHLCMDKWELCQEQQQKYSALDLKYRVRTWIYSHSHYHWTNNLLIRIYVTFPKIVVYLSELYPYLFCTITGHTTIIRHTASQLTSWCFNHTYITTFSSKKSNGWLNIIVYVIFTWNYILCNEILNLSRSNDIK